MENKVWEIKLDSDFCPYNPNRFKPNYINICEFAKPYSQDCTFDNCPIKASQQDVEVDIEADIEE